MSTMVPIFVLQLFFIRTRSLRLGILLRTFCDQWIVWWTFLPDKYEFINGKNIPCKQSWDVKDCSDEFQTTRRLRGKHVQVYMWGRRLHLPSCWLFKLLVSPGWLGCEGEWPSPGQVLPVGHQGEGKGEGEGAGRVEETQRVGPWSSVDLIPFVIANPIIYASLLDIHTYIASMKMYETRPEAQRLTPKRPVIWDSDTLSANASPRARATTTIVD